jgi:hypothetical protein
MAPRDKLTRKQRNLLTEVENIAELFGLDYSNILEYEPDSRSPMLEVMKNKLVRGQIIIWYTLVDEFLNSEICHYYFGKKRSFQQLWKTKRFQFFNHYILEELYPLQKLRFVKAFRPVPKPISQSIEALNVLRNGLAHAFFPENTRKMKPSWKGKNIFGFEGAEAFMSDMQKVADFFLGRASKSLVDAPPNPALKSDLGDAARPSAP